MVILLEGGFEVRNWVESSGADSISGFLEESGDKDGGRKFWGCNFDCDLAWVSLSQISEIKIL